MTMFPPSFKTKAKRRHFWTPSPPGPGIHTPHIKVRTKKSVFPVGNAQNSPGETEICEEKFDNIEMHVTFTFFREGKDELWIQVS